jgi:hypothetical protein
MQLALHNTNRIHGRKSTFKEVTFMRVFRGTVGRTLFSTWTSRCGEHFPSPSDSSWRFAGEASNLLSHTEYGGANNTAFVGSLGNPNLVNGPGTGLIPGLGTSSTFGTIGVGTFDPPQITMQARLSFEPRRAFREEKCDRV